MDLEPFTRINPCGFEGLAVTQLSDHVAIDLPGAEQQLRGRLAALLGYNDRFQERASALPEEK
jgi:lipoyl(octanoyl) transferase